MKNNNISIKFMNNNDAHTLDQTMQTPIVNIFQTSYAKFSSQLKSLKLFHIEQLLDNQRSLLHIYDL